MILLEEAETRCRRNENCRLGLLSCSRRLVSGKTYDLYSVKLLKIRHQPTLEQLLLVISLLEFVAHRLSPLLDINLTVYRVFSLLTLKIKLNFCYLTLFFTASPLFGSNSEPLFSGPFQAFHYIALVPFMIECSRGLSH